MDCPRFISQTLYPHFLKRLFGKVAVKTLFIMENEIVNEVKFFMGECLLSSLGTGNLFV